MQLDLIDLCAAAARRDAAIQQVSDNSGDWIGLAFTTAKSILWMMPDEWTPEDLKHQLRLHIPDPHHHNSYGALTMKLIRAGLIEKTGRYGHSKDPASHKTVAPYYRRRDG